MAHHLVEEAVVAKLSADWSLCPVVTENGSVAPPADGAPYLVLQFPIANARRVTVNERRYREEGAFRLVLHVRAGSGLARLRDWSEQLSALFRDQSFGGVVCQVPGPPFTDGKGADGGYFWAAIVAPYTFNYTA